MALKKSLVALSLVLLTMVSPLSAKDGNKTVKTKVTQGVYLEYNGLVEKKTPMGNGKLTVYVNDKAVDVISGVFNNNSITDATITFKGGKSLFKGNIQYSTSETEIVYTFSNGFFEIDYSQYENSFVLPIENMVVHRNWKTSKLSTDDEEPIQFKFKKSIVETKKNPDTYNYFVNVKPVITKEWTVTLYLSDDVSTYNLYPSDNDIDCYVIDYGEKGKGYLTKSGIDDILEIKCPNGDSLSKVGRDCLNALRNIDGGKLELNLFYYDGNFDIEKKYYDKEKMPLVEKFNREMPDEYKNWIGRNFELGIDNREKQMADKGELSSCRNPSHWAVEVTYSNGDTYFGTYYMDSDMRSVIIEVMNTTKLPQEEDYYCGLYTTKQGEKIYYLYGYTADKYVQLASQRDKRKKDEWQRQQQEARKEYQAREKAAKDRRLAQEKKYGKKYVDAIYDQYTILVGTPEGLLKEQYILDVKTETTKSIVYYVKRTHDVLFIVWVDKSTHKVDMVTNLQ